MPNLAPLDRAYGTLAAVLLCQPASPPGSDVDPGVSGDS